MQGPTHLSLFTRPRLLHSLVKTASSSSLLPETNTRLLNLFSLLVVNETAFLGSEELTNLYPPTLSAKLLDVLFQLLLNATDNDDFPLYFKQVLQVVEHFAAARDREQRLEELLEKDIIAFTLSHFEEDNAELHQAVL